jgi:protein TonB
VNEFELERMMGEVVAGVANAEVPRGLAERLKAKSFAMEGEMNENVLNFGTLDRLAGGTQTRKTAMGALALHVAVLLLVFFEMRALQLRLAAPAHVESEVLLSAPPPLLPPNVTAAGGGGGHAGPAPVTRGTPPKAATVQMMPMEQPPVVEPKLATTPTVVMQQDLKMAQSALPQFGAANSPLVGASLGNGRGTGIGAGFGAGVGAGSGGNMGGGIRRIGGGVSAPEVLFAPEPEFSEEARKSKVSGNVLVYLQVNEQGRPVHVRVLRGLGMGLDEKALEAVRQYRFKPAMEEGRPVAVEMNVEVNFNIYSLLGVP